MSFKDIKRIIRQNEAKNHMTPLEIYKKKDKDGEYWTFSFSKLVAYKNRQEQTNQHWYKAEDELNYDLHAGVLSQHIASELKNIDVLVKVKPKFKKFLGIPLKIPFTNTGLERAPDKVRGDSNADLATMQTTVKVKLRGKALQDIDGQTLWNALNHAACLHTENYLSKDTNGQTIVNPIANNMTSRPTKNPLRRLAKFMSPVVPSVVSNTLPNAVRNMGRTNRYGTPFAERKLDYPLINSGIVATTTNTALAATAGVAAAAVVAGAIMLEVKIGGNLLSNSGGNSTGLTLGLLSKPTMGNIVMGEVLACNGSTNELGRGYVNGMLFQQSVLLTGYVVGGVAAGTVAAVDVACSPDGNAPFATRTVIR